MTAPAPLDPLLNKERLAVWAQERPLLDPEFADLVIDAVSTLVRRYGNPAWEAETIPHRARDIAYIVARDYYLNPNLIRSETVGPLQESRAEGVLRGIDLSADQQAELGALAGGGTSAPGGLSVLSTTRGPVETHQLRSPNNLILWDTRAGWPIEFLDESEAVVFFPEELA